MEDPKRTLLQYTDSVCVAEVHCWEILGQADPWNVISVLSICPRIFFRVFIVYRPLLLLHSSICSCVLVVSVSLSVLAMVWYGRV